MKVAALPPKDMAEHGHSGTAGGDGRNGWLVSDVTLSQTIENKYGGSV
jgi:hypothetical protein